MKVTQLTVFLENRSGRLAEVADLLGAAGINIRGFSTTEAAEYGIVRLIVTDPVKGRALLHDAGFTTHFSQVICVRVPDEPGGLARRADRRLHVATRRDEPCLAQAARDRRRGGAHRRVGHRGEDPRRPRSVGGKNRAG